jgi:hypothetical protein
MSHANTSQRNAQKGFIAILLLVTIAIAAVAAFSKNIWGSDPQAMQQKITQDALKQAKEALLAYVEVGVAGDLTSANFLRKANGRLPCPDQDGDGKATTSIESPCGIIPTYGAGYHSLGLFPWAQLGIPPIRDAAHECLWLAVDGRFKLSTATSPLNSDAVGSFTIIQPIKNPITGVWTESVLAGNPTAATASDPNRVVAVIIAPGAAIGGQSRAINTGTGAGITALSQQPCTLTTTYSVPFNGILPTAQKSSSNYLESYTSTASSGLGGNNSALTNTPNKDPLASPNLALQTFVQADANQEKLNDQLIWITAEEFSKAVTKRAARILANYINTYVTANNKYPPAAAAAGGACVTSPTPLLQGYVPYSCPGTTGTGDMTMAQGTDRLYGDPDWWYGLSHYAVSETCVSGGTAANPCNGVAKVNVGSGAAVPALILMRGKAAIGQACPYTAGPLGTPNISVCIEGANAPTVAAAAISPLTAASGIASAIYAVPDPKSSNDYMIQFTAK